MIEDAFHLRKKVLKRAGMVFLKLDSVFGICQETHLGAIVFFHGRILDHLQTELQFTE